MAVQYVVTQTCDACGSEISKTNKSADTNVVTVSSRGIEINVVHQPPGEVTQGQLCKFDEICDKCLDKITAVVDKLTKKNRKAAPKAARKTRAKAAKAAPADKLEKSETAASGDAPAEPKRKRGRPRKTPIIEAAEQDSGEGAEAETPAPADAGESTFVPPTNGVAVESGEAAHPF